ncbi:MAG: hypothetical protein LW685_06225 [Algoriphagus sp.]|nr:hypothetical protein [Algoriphagus sp.]
MGPRKSITFLLRKTQSPLQLIAGIFGSFVGIFIVGLAVQLYAEYTHLISNQGNVAGYQFIIINKKVSALNTLKRDISQFSSEDLDRIRDLGVVEDIGVFKSNQFSVEGILQIPGQNGGFGSEMFLESVEDQFIDQTPEDWNWKIGDETVPLILPTDFLNLYNFNFAPSRGLPVLSQKTTKLARFSISISGEKGQETFVGRIAGYSSRINSILVPLSFMEFANEKFTANTPQKSGKIIVSIKDDKIATLYKLIKELDWETNEDKLRSGKFAAILELLISIMVLVGLLIVAVSFSSTILYVILAINKSRYEIDTLMLIGVPRTFIVRWYIGNLGMINAFIGIGAGIALILFKNKLDEFAAGYSYQLLEKLHFTTYLIICSTLLFITLIQYLRIRKLDR